MLDIIKDNETIPVILVDDNGEITANRNLDSAKAEDKAYLNKQLAEMKLDREPIKILYDDANEKYKFLFNKNFIILIQLKWHIITCSAYFLT